MQEFNRLIEQLYGAALDPGQWPGAIDSMRMCFGCTAAGLYTQNLARHSVNIVHLDGIDPVYVQAYRDHYTRDNPWNWPALQVVGKVRTESTLDEYHNHPGFYHRTALYNEWMKPQGFMHTLGTNVTASPRERTKLFLYRSSHAKPFATGDVARFRCLINHLGTAVKVTRQLDEHAHRSQRLLDLFERIDTGLVFLDRHGAIVEANAFARAIFATHETLTTDTNTVTATNRDAAPRLHRAIACALGMRNGELTETIPSVALPAASGLRILDVRVIPLMQQDTIPFGDSTTAALMVMTYRGESSSQATGAIQQRYRLTAAEAKLVRWLLCGASLRQAADLMHVKYETVRWYLKNIFQKTGTRRQADLVRQLLADDKAPGPGD